MIRNKMTLLLLWISFFAIGASGQFNCIDGDVHEGDKNYYGDRDPDGDGYNNRVDCSDQDPNRWVFIIAYPDHDGDAMPEQGPTINICSGTTTHAPAGWTFNDSPMDPCPNDPENICGVTVPFCQLAGVANGHTTTLTATATYTNGSFDRVIFYAGNMVVKTDTTPADGWTAILTNVPNGVYTYHAIAFATDGNSALSNFVTITINDTGACMPTLTITWAYAIAPEKTYYGGWFGSCFTSIFGQDPWWQFGPFSSCHECSQSGVVFPGSLNLGFCEFSGTVPRSLNENPTAPFTTDRGDIVDYFITGYPDGHIYNGLAPGSPAAYFDNCASIIQLSVAQINHPWGANYFIAFTAPLAGNTANIFVTSPIDSDSDGWMNACPPNTTCQADNCIRFENQTQLDSNSDGVGDACTANPDPNFWDQDNDWYLDGPNVAESDRDHYPTDRTRH
ncbi:MAG: hypothetical protein NTZ49_01945 [Candidatus Parcubacteria bacterium]|nr:hypothetical protein [Candidatus Parcubacteria bacterium]